MFLYGFIEYGSNFFNKVNGIFAASIFDKKLNKIFFARDFIGVKPLYYTYDNYTFSFSSELKSLVRNQNFKGKLNEKVLNEFLYYKYVTGKETLIKNIFKFQPGKVYKIDLNKKKIKLEKFSYYKFKEKDNFENIESATTNIYRLLQKSIKSQVQSDANLGIQLSGGIDSTLITELAINEKNIKHLYFSSFKSFKKDEFKYAYEVSKKLKLNLKRINHNKEFFDKNLNKTIYHLDEPLNHPHSISIFQISEIAKRNVSVILTGEGADELFFGYERYTDVLKKNIKEIDLLKNGAFLRTRRDIELYNKFKTDKYGDPHSNRFKLLNKINVENKLKKFQVFETQTHLQSLLLRSDKMMMANSIEARVPFLDKDIYDYSLNLSDKIKKNQNQKLILKRILLKRGYSKNFVMRKKIGYIVPLNDWIIQHQNFKKDLIKENLLNFFDKKALENLTSELSNNKNLYSNAKLYWLMKNLDSFIDIFELN